MPSKILPSVYRIEGEYAGEYGYLSSYLFIADDECLVIDPRTAGSPGKKILKAIKALGLKASRDVIGILCTHAHPDHVGGVKMLKEETGAPVIIHADAVPLLREPGLFTKSRLRLNLSERIAMKFERGPLRVNYDGQEADTILNDRDLVHIGNSTLQTILTAGHSAGHCAFYDSNRKILFCGDEIANFPNSPRKFYVDLSGSMIAKRSALEKIKKMEIDYLLPAHDIPHLFGDARAQIVESLSGVISFQDSVLEHVCIRAEADIEQLVFDITKANSVPYPKKMNALLPTTILVALRSLRKAGLVFEEEGIWMTENC